MITTDATARPALLTGRLERTTLWSGLGLGFALSVAAGLNFWNLTRNGYANLYYSVVVQSMLQSRHNFFFVACDAGGVVSVDKPPLALRVQALSAKLLSGAVGASVYGGQATSGGRNGEGGPGGGFLNGLSGTLSDCAAS